MVVNQPLDTTRSQWTKIYLSMITHIITETEAEYQSDAGSTKDTPCLALTGELWGVFCEYLWENWPRYNGTALYIYVCVLSLASTF